MARRKYLTGTQSAVLTDLFGGEVGRQAVLRRHGIRAKTFDRWMQEELFSAEYYERLRGACAEWELILAKYSPVAAARLIELTGSSHDETARRACVDVLKHLRAAAGESGKNGLEGEEMGEYSELSVEVAGRLLAVLAKEKQQKT